MSTRTRWLQRLALAAGLLAASAAGALAQPSPASSSCPTQYFLGPELALNPSFETAGPAGETTCWSSGGPPSPPSAAGNWTMHSSNSQATVCSKLVPTTAPGPSGQKMLLFRAGGNEGGIYQVTNADPTKSYMFSAWVFVKKGQVALQSSGGVGGPNAWSTKLGEWEQLRVCNNSQFGVDWLVIYNQDPNGGEFYVDRAELREIPTLQ